jgi:hypothetical protein
MKLAHLILAHNNPSQLERLAKRLSHPDADIYIHLDNKTDIAAYQPIKDIPNTFFIKKRVNVAWGEYSVMQATLNGMEEILGTGIAYSHINLLSGNDYPLKSAAEIQKYFFANPGKTFMWYEPIFDEWNHGQARMNNYYFGDYGFPGRHHLANLANKVLPKRRLPGNLTAYGRAQWLTITPAGAAYVINYIKNNPAAERFFRMTWAVDEVFFQTILCNSPLLNTLVNDNFRYVVLQPDFRPATLTIADSDALLTSGKFYARKFDTNTDAAILDYIDEKSLLS